ncbi:MAG: SPOR domain-containing protein [Candidatus Omnitrophica bacterium]|nr:SPOR domain-containing protein [Candidatus Omnitrophota bacterium]
MQSELFDLSIPKAQESVAPLKPTFIERTSIVLRLDQAIGLALLLLVFCVLAYCWGVEQGRRWTGEARPARSVASEDAVPADVPQVVAELPVVPVTSVPGPVAQVKPAVSSPEFPKPEVAVPKPDGKYTIQYITYVTQSAADREVQRIKKLGHSAFVIPSGKFFQVCIEAFQTRQEATQSLKQLRAQRMVTLDAYVRTIPA